MFPVSHVWLSCILKHIFSYIFNTFWWLQAGGSVQHCYSAFPGREGLSLSLSLALVFCPSASLSPPLSTCPESVPPLLLPLSLHLPLCSLCTPSPCLTVSIHAHHRQPWLPVHYSWLKHCQFCIFWREPSCPSLLPSLPPHHGPVPVPVIL